MESDKCNLKKSNGSYAIGICQTDKSKCETFRISRKGEDPIVYYPKFKWKKSAELPTPKATIYLGKGKNRYKAEFYNITPEEIERNPKKFKEIMNIHGAEHSVAMFEKFKKKSGQIGIYCDPLLTMKGEKEYVLRYTNQYKYPIVVLTHTRELKELLETKQVPNIKAGQRWCTQEFKIKPTIKFIKQFKLEHAVNLKGIQKNQSGERSKKEIKYGKENITKGFTDEHGVKTAYPIYYDNEFDNLQIMCKFGVPMNKNCIIAQRHGCLECPYNRNVDAYERMKKEQPKEFEKIKKWYLWGSKTRIEKYNYYNENLKKFKRAGIPKEEIKRIYSYISRENKFKGNKKQKLKGLKNQILESYNFKYKDFDYLPQEVKEKKLKKVKMDLKKYNALTDREKNQIYKSLNLDNQFYIKNFNDYGKREWLKNYFESEKGQSKLLPYLEQRFETIKENSKKGLYVKFRDRPDLL